MKLDYCVEQLDTPLENVGFRSHRSPDGGGDMELGNCETEREALKLAIKSLSVMVACWLPTLLGAGKMHIEPPFKFVGL